ncbi:MAG: hypothetical protein P8Z68_07915, partial [Kineosporiaceae bacterium]
MSGPGPVSAQPSWVQPQADGWATSDAWVLSAVRVTGTQEEPASLADIIVAGDFLYQVILSVQEIEHAVGRLMAAMLITADERGFAVTPVGRQVVARARGGDVNRAEALHQILSMLQVAPVPFRVDPHEYEAACLEHRHRTWKAFGGQR